MSPHENLPPPPPFLARTRLPSQSAPVMCRSKAIFYKQPCLHQFIPPFESRCSVPVVVCLNPPLFPPVYIPPRVSHSLDRHLEACDREGGTLLHYVIGLCEWATPPTTTITTSPSASTSSYSSSSTKGDVIDCGAGNRNVISGEATVPQRVGFLDHEERAYGWS